MSSELIERLLAEAKRLEAETGIDASNFLHAAAAEEIIRLQNEMRSMVSFERYRETAEENQRLRGDLRLMADMREDAEG